MKLVKERFRNRLVLKVDTVKQQMGTTNDGNTSRRFSADTSLCAEITEINETLMEKLAIILNTINCGRQIDVVKFESFATQTARLYVELYGWHRMPNTVHKVLLHGSRTISQVPDRDAE